MAIQKAHLHGKRAASRSVPLVLRILRLLFSGAGKYFPVLLGRLAYFLWFRTQRVPESSAGKRAAREAVREILKVNNIPVVIHRWGTSGPIVLFVHGWSGRGSQVSSFVAPLQDEGFQVLAVDLPGHGESPGKRTNILECARVIEEVDSKDGPLYAVITHSFGGMVMGYALQHGVGLERAVIISAPSDVEFLVESFSETLHMHPAVVDDLWHRLELRFDADFSERISTVNNVSDLDIPALVVHDEDDVNVPIAQGQRIAATWPDARFLKTSGLGHGRILRDRDVVDTVVSFIKGRTGYEQALNQ